MYAIWLLYKESGTMPSIMYDLGVDVQAAIISAAKRVITIDLFMIF